MAAFYSAASPRLSELYRDKDTEENRDRIALEWEKEDVDKVRKKFYIEAEKEINRRKNLDEHGPIVEGEDDG